PNTGIDFLPALPWLSSREWAIVRGLLSRVLADDVHQVLLVILQAYILHDFGVLQQVRMPVQCEWPCIGAWVVDGYVEIHMPEIHAPVAFGHMQFLSVRMRGVVKPSLFIESYRVHHQRVSIPLSDRIAEPRRVHVLRMATAVHEDLPVAVHVAFV